MTKVALVNPGKDPQKFAISEPLPLGYLASSLEKHNIEVKIIDQLAGQNVKSEIRKYQPDIVGITGTTPLIPAAYEIADMCREMGILTVMGGKHVSALPEEALQHADKVVVGEGEEAIVEIVKNKVRSKIVEGSFIKNLDDIPPPARHLIQMEFYIHKDKISDPIYGFIPPRTKVAIVITSRGCPFRCIFCYNSWRQTPIRFHSPERVVTEIMDLVKTYDIEALYFQDDNLFINRPRLRKICKLMMAKKIDVIWGCLSRADTLDLKTIRMAKKAGCREINIGFESGSQRILDILNKGTTVAQNYKAVKLIKKAGLRVFGAFILGNPTETIEDVRATQRFIRENDIDNLAIGFLTPYPGTVLWQWCKKNNLLPESPNWSEFATGTQPGMNISNIPRKELERLFLEISDEFFERRPIKFSWVFKHPIEAVTRAIKYPKRIPHLLKRLK